MATTTTGGACSNDCHDCVIDDQEGITRQGEGEGEREAAEGDTHKREGSVKSITAPRSLQYASRLARNFSTHSTFSREDRMWIRSRLSINSNSSATSGIGSLSTNPSHLDLTVFPATPPIERISKLSFVSRSASSSMHGNRRPLRSSFQKEGRKATEDDSSSRGGASIGRNKSWTNSKLIRKGYVTLICTNIIIVLK